MSGQRRVNRKSSKQRKLKYIRDKNRLREGKAIYSVIKINANVDFMPENRIKIFGIISKQFANIKSKYKMELGVHLCLRYLMDDFANNLISIVCEYRHKPYHDIYITQKNTKMDFINSNPPRVDPSERILNPDERINKYFDSIKTE